MHIISFASKTERKKTMGCHFRHTELTKNKTILGGGLVIVSIKIILNASRGCSENNTTLLMPEKHKEP